MLREENIAIEIKSQGYELVRDGASAEPYLPQARGMAEKAKAAGLNIDYFPTNFVVRDGLIWYVDYECNAYMDEWSFESWGVRYWSRTPEFEAYLDAHKPTVAIREAPGDEMAQCDRLFAAAAERITDGTDGA